MKKKVKLVPFEKSVAEVLRDPEVAALYLKEALEYKGPRRNESLIRSINHVVKAQRIRFRKRKKV